ncbi:MAG: glycerol kinase GlpK [Clostridia bacterium]|nr:glycerol kinase GlpK [Clostridia bacterium]
MGNYILSLDEGTTSARAVLFDHDGHIVDMVQREFPQIYPKPGWVEQDPMEIYASQYGVMMELIAKRGLSPADIHAIGITHQRETAILWARRTREPVSTAIHWQCRRTAPLCDKLKAEGLAPAIQKTTGLLIDAYFSATKLAWILDNVPGARERAKNGELCFGTVDTWLLWRMTEGRVHATDVTNASRTMLYDIRRGDWDDALLARFDIPRTMLPKVLPSSAVYGYFRLDGQEIPIAGIAGDQQAALFGQLCTEPGESKNTYGTGCFLLMHTGETPKFSENGLLTTIAATLSGQPTQYALEGSVFVGGAVIQWLRDAMGLIRDAEDSEYFASKVSDTGGVYIVPAFTGLGAPHWDMYARGTIVGMTRDSGRNRIVRAALESIAYQTNDILTLMAKESGIPITVLKADGGASANKLLMQMQADISHVTVRRPAVRETTAMGAAFLAGLAAGFWHDIPEIRSCCSDAFTEFTPCMAEDTRASLLKGWQRALKAARAWSLEEEL